MNTIIQTDTGYFLVLGKGAVTTGPVLWGAPRIYITMYMKCFVHDVTNLQVNCIIETQHETEIMNKAVKFSGSRTSFLV
jgi:hypothetical protein